MKLTIPDYIQAIDPYVPGKPLEELERESGITDSVKLASNENPLGPSPMALAAIQRCLSTLHRYPDGAAHHLTGKIARFNGVSAANVVVGNGSDDIIALLVRALVRPGNRVIVPRPSFLMYAITAAAAGAVVDAVPLDPSLAMDLDAMARCVTADTRLIFLCNPNNPTGTVVTRSDFDRFMDQIPDGVVVVVDEAYIEFARHSDCLKTGGPRDVTRPQVTLRTFSKAYGLAGLRVGYGIMPAALAEVLNRVRQPFNVSAVAQAAAAAALDDRAFVRRTIALVHRELAVLYSGLDRLGLNYFKTEANFFLIEVGMPAQTLFDDLLRQGVIVRSMKAYGFPTRIRISVGLEAENRRFLQALETVLTGTGRSS